MSKNKNVKIVPADGPDPLGWMLTFSDLITLMLTFFVLLLTMSSLDDQKARTISQAASELVYAAIQPEEPVPANPTFIPSIQLLFQVARNLSAEPDTTTSDLTDVRNTGNTPLGQLVQEVRRERVGEDETWVSLVDLTNRFGIDEKIVFSADREGIRVRLPESLTFGPGDTEVSPDANPLLAKIAEAASVYDLSVSVEGHTDNRPPEGGSMADNWSLSAARSSSVVKRMLALASGDETRYSAAAMGDTRPVASNDTADGRQENRRVEIRMKPTRQSLLQERRPGDIDPDPLRPVDPRLLIDTTVPTGEMGSLGVTVTSESVAEATAEAEGDVEAATE
ncbi:MAG: flagellar motor protein MotB [Deltaproteobacteria bacterium]|nr:flagellar motor protein MotB [Deltaproteobacteria bacterium]MCB9488571.1 flagellar motor protein MotB [Deltaproteobacteria bacterium]